MAYFPRVGVELSTQARLSFLRAPLTHDRPAHMVRFANGAKSGRFKTPARTLNFTIIFDGPAADMAVMDAFFNDYGVIVPFTVDHPHLGEGLCYLVLQKHQIEPVVAGDPVWYRIEIPIEGAS
jgi:hypothetical protein